MPEKITVIVPVYGAEKYIEKCVGSITEQTYRDLEILLVDDGSRDRSGEICDELAAEDARIRVIHKENGGLTSAWSRGVSESTGKYLCFVDSDDWIDADMIERLAAHLDPSYEEAQVISCGFIIERTSGKGSRGSETRDSAAPSGEYTGEKLEKEIKGRILGNETRTMILSRCMKLVSRKLIEDNVHYCDSRVRMGEDVNIMVPAILDAKRVVLVEKYYPYHYLLVDDSMAHGYDPGLYDNVKALHEVLRKILKDKGYGDRTDMADREFLYLLFLELKHEVRRDDAPEGEIYERIRSILDAENVKELLKDDKVCIRDNADRILSVLVRHPGRLCFSLVRAIFRMKK